MIKDKDVARLIPWVFQHADIAGKGVWVDIAIIQTPWDRPARTSSRLRHDYWVEQTVKIGPVILADLLILRRVIALNDPHPLHRRHQARNQRGTVADVLFSRASSGDDGYWLSKRTSLMAGHWTRQPKCRWRECQGCQATAQSWSFRIRRDKHLRLRNTVAINATLLKYGVSVLEIAGRVCAACSRHFDDSVDVSRIKVTRQRWGLWWELRLLMSESGSWSNRQLTYCHRG